MTVGVGVGVSEVSVGVGVGVGVTEVSVGVGVGVGVSEVSVGVGVGVVGGKQQSVSYTTLTGVEPDNTTNESFSKQNSNLNLTVSGYVDAVNVRP